MEEKEHEEGGNAPSETTTSPEVEGGGNSSGSFPRHTELLVRNPKNKRGSSLNTPTLKEKIVDLYEQLFQVRFQKPLRASKALPPCIISKFE